MTRRFFCSSLRFHYDCDGGLTSASVSIRWSSPWTSLLQEVLRAYPCSGQWNTLKCTASTLTTFEIFKTLRLCLSTSMTTGGLKKCLPIYHSFMSDCLLHFLQCLSICDSYLMRLVIRVCAVTCHAFSVVHHYNLSCFAVVPRTLHRKSCIFAIFNR